MKNGKILLVTTYYNLKGNSASIRNNILCKGLINLGYQVDVLTLDWPESVQSEYLIKENNGNVKSTATLATKLFKGVQLAKANSILRFIIPIKNLLKDFIYFPDICSSWPKIIANLNIDLNSYALLISSSDLKSSHFAGVELKKKRPDLEYFQVWGDPWYEDISLKPVLKPIVRYYEKKLLKVASKIFYVSEITLEKQKLIYSKFSNKMRFCPRGYYKESFSSASQEELRILYPGSLGFGRNIDWFADLLDYFNSNFEISIKLVVYTNKKMANHLRQWRCIEFHSSQDLPVIFNEYKKTSALLFLENEKTTGQIPGKLFDYFGTNMPIFCILNNDSSSIKKFIKKYPRCLIFNKAQSLGKYKNKKTLTKILNLLKQRYAPEKKYSPEAVAKCVLKQLCKPIVSNTN